VREVRARADKTDEAPRLRIGELAAQLGLNPRTIRYYELVGVLPSPRRTPAGYRLYGPADRERLRFIVNARVAGLRLAEVREVLTLRQRGTPPGAPGLDLLTGKCAAIDRQVRILRGFRQELTALRDQAARAMIPAAAVRRPEGGESKFRRR